MGADQECPQRLAHGVVQAESGEIADDAGVALGETALVEPLGDRQGELVESASLVLERTARAGAEERVTPTRREQRGKRVRIDVGGEAIGETGRGRCPRRGGRRSRR